MTLLSSLLRAERRTRPCQPFILLQSSAGQSSLPILRNLIEPGAPSHENLRTAQQQTLLFCLLYPPSFLSADPPSQSLRIYDFLSNVAGYADKWFDPRDAITSAVLSAPAGPLDVIIDSLDTLASDVGSVPQTYRFLHGLLTAIRTRSQQQHSRLIVHVLSPSELIPMLIRPAFCPSLTHIIAHPPIILTHLAVAYFVPPPPVSPARKFWTVFLPFSERGYETDQLIFGPRGEGSTNNVEIVVEIVTRSADASKRKRAIDRTLEGWCTSRGGSCDLRELPSLKLVFEKKMVEEVASDPTQNLSFNLNLTPSQQESRARVPLPYAHEGKSPDISTSVILYDPDSADDLDDDDPDEDLDI